MEGFVKVEVYDIVILFSIFIGGFVQCVVDKNDLSEEILYGKKYYLCYKFGCLLKKELWFRFFFYFENVYELRGMNVQFMEEGFLLIIVLIQLMRNG